MCDIWEAHIIAQMEQVVSTNKTYSIWRVNIAKGYQVTDDTVTQDR